MKIFVIRFITITSIILTNINSYSQFNSSFEKGVLENFRKDSTNSYNLLNAINYNEELYTRGKRQINAHIASLKSKNLQLKPLKKQIETIYKTTHSKFFKKYEAEAYFNKIFENGTYNCVTASALYALIFDEFNINYSIKETPTHVYLIADTLNLQTLIESTLPGTGVVSYNEKFKKDYIDYLNTNKIISDKEFVNSSTEELFRSYYSKDKSIKLSQLAAIQYYNKGIFLMMEEKYTGAISYFKKALEIYPSNSIRYNNYAAIQNALVNDINKKLYNGSLFGQILQSSINDSSVIQFLSEFYENISVELCIKSPDIDRYNKFYQEFVSQCSSCAIPDEIMYNYFYYRAYYYGITGNYSVALSEIIKAFKLYPDNLLVRELAQQFGIKHMFIENRYKNQIDSLEYYFEELPFLLENQLFQQQYVYLYMRVIAEYYTYDEPEEGNIYYIRFLKAIEEYNINQYSDQHISNGFGAISYYLAEEGDFSAAAKVVNKGLELAPESLQLKQVKSEINNRRQMERDYKQYNSKYNNNNQEVVYSNSNFKTPEELNDEVNKYFPGKWKAVSIIMEDMEQDLTDKEIFSFVAEKDKNCTYTLNSIVEKGKWAYRLKSKCIYFVPNNDKDNYKVFKIKEISAEKLVLLPYKDQKNPSPYKYILVHTN